MRLILFNLIGNAIKHRDRDRPDPQVRVDGRILEDRRRVEIRVSDNGIGVPPDALADAFTYRIRDDEDGASGSGLGLAIVREAIEQLAGDIAVESPSGRGTTFVLTFTPPESSAPPP
jgi:signal transduction histidine kinase